MKNPSKYDWELLTTYAIGALIIAVGVLGALVWVLSR